MRADSRMLSMHGDKRIVRCDSLKMQPTVWRRREMHLAGQPQGLDRRRVGSAPIELLLQGNISSER
jgi:hypothetical protein